MGDRIKIGLRRIGWEILDWITLAQDKDKWPALLTLNIPRGVL